MQYVCCKFDITHERGGTEEESQSSDKDFHKETRILKIYQIPCQNVSYSWQLKTTLPRNGILQNKLLPYHIVQTAVLYVQ